MDTRLFCAYNKTSKRFLGPRLKAVDAAREPIRVLKLVMEGLAPNDADGLWVINFHGIPIARTSNPFDLVYLDDGFRVLQAIEISRDSVFEPFKGQPESALILPAHTVLKSKTFTGDQVLIANAEQTASPAPAASAPPTRPPAISVPARVAPVAQRTISVGPRTAPQRGSGSLLKSAAPTIPAAAASTAVLEPESAAPEPVVIEPVREVAQAAPAATIAPIELAPTPEPEILAAPELAAEPAIEETATPAPADSKIVSNPEISAPQETAAAPEITAQPEAAAEPETTVAPETAAPEILTAPVIEETISPPLAEPLAEAPVEPPPSPATELAESTLAPTPAVKPVAEDLPVETQPIAEPAPAQEPIAAEPVPTASIAAEPPLSASPVEEHPPAPAPAPTEPAPEISAPEISSDAALPEQTLIPFPATETSTGQQLLPFDQPHLAPIAGASISPNESWPAPPPSPDPILVPNGHHALQVQPDQTALQPWQQTIDPTLINRWDVRLIHSLFPELHPSFRPQFQAPRMELFKDGKEIPRSKKLPLKIRLLHRFYPGLHLDTLEQRQRESRRSPRLPKPGLVGYYFTGGISKPHEIQNISVTGFFMKTEERLLPGTVIRMTLQVEGSTGEDPNDTITVHSRVISWSPTGGGFEFVLPGFLEQ